MGKLSEPGRLLQTSTSRPRNDPDISLYSFSSLVVRRRLRSKKRRFYLPHDCRLTSKKAVHSPRWDLFRERFDERDQALMRVTNPQTGKPGPLGWLQIDVPDIRLKWEQVKAPFSGFKLQSRDTICIDATGPGVTVFVVMRVIRKEPGRRHWI